MADSDLETPPRPERKATLRLGARELTLIRLAVIAVIILPALFVGYRVVLNFKAKRDITIAESNLHAIYTALQSYSLDWDNRLPAADRWMDTAAGYLPSASGIAGGKLSYLQGPGDGAAIRYVYNDEAAGYNLEHTAKDDRQSKLDPSHLVLLIEQPGAEPNAHMHFPPQYTAQDEDALYKLLSFPHYADDPDNATTVVLYASGKVVTLKRLDFKQGMH